MSEDRRGKLGRMRAALVWSAGLGLMMALVPLFMSWEHLPNPIATHFGPSGAPDGKLGRLGFAVVLLAQLLVPAYLAWPRRRRGDSANDAAAGGASAPAGPGRVALVGFMSATSVVLVAITIALNWQVAKWSEARPFQLWMLLPLLGFPLLVAVALGALGRRLWPQDAPLLSLHILPLAEGERAYWTGGASNRWLLAVAFMLVGQVATLHLVVQRSGGIFTSVTVVLVLSLIVIEQFSKIRVTVNDRAVTIRFGRLGWIKQRIDMHRIVSAAAFQLEAWDNGGWGYRLRGGRGRAIVVRSGSAIRLELANGAQVAITVDDADTAARLINGFVQRRGAAPPENPAAIPALQPSR